VRKPVASTSASTSSRGSGTTQDPITLPSSPVLAARDAPPAPTTVARDVGSAEKTVLATVNVKCVGIQYYDGASSVRSGQKLRIDREPSNPYDSNAINVKLPGGGMTKVGHIPRNVCARLAPLMDQGLVSVMASAGICAVFLFFAPFMYTERRYKQSLWEPSEHGLASYRPSAFRTASFQGRPALVLGLEGFRAEKAPLSSTRHENGTGSSSYLSGPAPELVLTEKTNSWKNRWKICSSRCPTPGASKCEAKISCQSTLALLKISPASLRCPNPKTCR
jgi:hypothetical protein